MYRGCGVDDPLSERGWRQMRSAVEGERGWQRIVSSPMRRCLAFARELSRERGLPLAVEADLREMAFGAWEGRRPEDLLAADADAYRAFLDDPVTALPAGAESPESLLRRVAAVLQRLPDQAGGEHLLVIAHGGVIRAAVAWAIGLPPSRLFRLRLDYAGMSRLQGDDRDHLTLSFHGRAPGG